IFPNVFEPPLLEFFDKEKGGVVKHNFAGKWHSEVFKNNNPIVLELGCGKGEYSVGMGKKFPDVNYIGIDIKGARIWFGAKESL
ncbi:MAG: tRNA (guanosine(46)-N7)-methyltransferase TrmB, partial [Flavobacteriales bacterium]